MARTVMEQVVTPVEDIEVLAQAAAESPEWSADLEDCLAWLREHGYRIVVEGDR